MMIESMQARHVLQLSLSFKYFVCVLCVWLIEFDKRKGVQQMESDWRY